MKVLGAIALLSWAALLPIAGAATDTGDAGNGSATAKPTGAMVPDGTLIGNGVRRLSKTTDPKVQTQIKLGVLKLFAQLPDDHSKWMEFINSAQVSDPRILAVAKDVILKSMPPPQITLDKGGAASPETGPSGTPKDGIDQGLAMRRQIASEFRQRDPKNPESHFDFGQVLYNGKDYAGAVESFGKAYELGDHRPIVLVNLAGAAYSAGDYSQAERAALLALQADPGNEGAMAIYHFAKGRAPTVSLPSALGELGDSRSPGEDPSPSNRSEIQASIYSSPVGFAGATPPSGMTPAQVADLAQRAQAPGPDAGVRSAEYTKDAANAMRVRDYSTAYQLASAAINLNPSNAQALNYRAMTLSQMRRYSDAVQDASAALTLAPGSAAALQTRSWAFAKQGKYKESLVDAEATLERDPNNAFAYQNLAFARAGMGDREGAIDALKRSAAIDPRFTNRLERAVQMPQDQDLTLLFDDGSSSPAATAASVPAPDPNAQRRKFLRLAFMSLSGGLLIALGVLHIVSASWREKMRMTVRRVLGPSAVAAGSEAAAAPAAPGSGAFWTQYELIKEIGLGGMGVVYEAIDRSLERRVAVKKMRDEIRLDPQDRQRFVKEARTVAQLHNPSIVDIYGIVEDEADVYLVFEFVEGRTLQDALKSGGPMDVSRAAKVLREMASAVAHAHEKGIIHRDLKPSNVMLTTEGRVKVMDFGIARMAKDSMTRHSMTNTIAGTPPYMAPEQEQGTVRKESDVYALGVCLYEMTTGHLPFSGSGAAMLLNKLNGKLIPPSQRNEGLPPGLDAVIAKALAPDPDKRYRTPAELIGALDALTSVDLAS
ncbi:MAG: protein kinase [Elusimicrobia bacterium]|nr:protein kinase [Elusimicrobiota bacterium]